MNGAVGDVSPRPRGWTGVKTAGQALAAGVLRAWEHASVEPSGLQVATRAGSRFPSPTRRPPELSRRMGARLDDDRTARARCRRRPSSSRSGSAGRGGSRSPGSSRRSSASTSRRGRRRGSARCSSRGVSNDYLGLLPRPGALPTAELHRVRQPLRRARRARSCVRGDAASSAWPRRPPSVTARGGPGHLTGRDGPAVATGARGRRRGGCGPAGMGQARVLSFWRAPTSCAPRCSGASRRGSRPDRACGWPRGRWTWRPGDLPPSAVRAALSDERIALRAARLRWRRCSLCFIRLMADLVLATNACLLSWVTRATARPLPSALTPCQGVCRPERRRPARVRSRHGARRGERRRRDRARRRSRAECSAMRGTSWSRARSAPGPVDRRLLRRVPHPESAPPAPRRGRAVDGRRPGVQRDARTTSGPAAFARTVQAVAGAGLVVLCAVCALGIALAPLDRGGHGARLAGRRGALRSGRHADARDVSVPPAGRPRGARDGRS